MSATGRGAVRNERDFYATPLEAFIPILPIIACLPGPVWEPAAGDGRLVAEMWRHGIDAFGSDIHEAVAERRPVDFLDPREHPCLVWPDSMYEPPRTIVTNPPFSLAMEFARVAVANYNHVVLLLRLNFLASQKRRDWFKAHPPSAIFVLSERPSFTNNGKTDATDYAWIAWSSKLSGIHFL